MEHFPARGANEILNRGLERVRGVEIVHARSAAGVRNLDGGHDRAGEEISGGEISRPGHGPSRGRIHT
jgi:hypothetical protein